MRLTDLGPRWFSLEKGPPVALTFLCPHCRNVRIGIMFREHSRDAVVGPALFAKHGTSDAEVWELTGPASVATLTLMPSIEVDGHSKFTIVDGRIE